MSDIRFCITSASLFFFLSGIHSLCQFLVTACPVRQLCVGKNKSISTGGNHQLKEGKKEHSERWNLSPVDHSLASCTQAACISNDISTTQTPFCVALSLCSPLQTAGKYLLPYLSAVEKYNLHWQINREIIF